MDVEEQIRRIFDNEISYNIVYSGIQDDISFIIEDDTFLVGNLRSTISWSLVGQHVILYVEILNEKNRIDFNLILCPNHDVEREIITKMRNISSLISSVDLGLSDNMLKSFLIYQGLLAVVLPNLRSTKYLPQILCLYIRLVTRELRFTPLSLVVTDDR